MIQLARRVYLDEILFGKSESKERFEVLSFIELAFRFEDPEDFCQHLNSHLASRMFLVGHCITAADIVCFLTVAPFFKELLDFQKIQLNHCFRWLDHIQHLPGLQEQIEALSVFVEFPDET
jgi:hypothetical protein